MRPISDYHMHTKLCGHATGEPAEYIERAIKLGFKEIGFSDHAPFFSHRDANVTMDFAQVPVYHKMIENLQKQYKDKIKIKVAIEADYMRGYVPQVKGFLKEYPYDYVIGSVHFIDEWAFDNPDERPKWESHNIDDVYLSYHKLLREAALSGCFDIMGHVDLVKKFGDRPSKDISDIIDETAKTFKKAGVCIEVNSSGLRKPIGEIYPSLSNLKIYCKAGVPIVFGSDAHTPNEVGMDLEKAVDHAKAAGYKEYMLYKNRKIEKKIAL